METTDKPANITAKISGLPLAVRLGTGLALLAAALLLRTATAPAYSFSFILIIPVSFLVWFVSTRVGLLAGITSVVFLLVFEITQPTSDRAVWVQAWNVLTNTALLVFIVFILHQVKTLYLRETGLSREDPVTGLRNRRAFLEAVDLETKRMQRHATPTTVVYLDLDNFKDINDQFGHATGDAVLREVARTMSANVRGIDTIARLGGDEYCLLLPETDRAAARSAVEKLRERLLDTMQRKQWPVTFSIGAVTLDAPLASPDDFIDRADQVMYGVKQTGKDRAEFL